MNTSASREFNDQIIRPFKEDALNAEVTAQPTDLLPASAADLAKATPPRLWVLIADWGNILGGLFLTAAFLEGALINSVKLESLLVSPGGPPNQSALNWLQFLFCAEGACYAIAEFFMTGIMALTPAEFGGSARGVMQFAILTVGGVFFGLSGLIFPGCITNVTYVLRNQKCPHVAASGPYVWNAMAHFGITCFMVGTAIGFAGILKAPKNKFVSPFWGVTMFFLGAWTIGIFKFWGPVLCGGFDSHQNGASMSTFDLHAPTLAWTWNWWFGVLGAVYLTIGAAIFGMINGSFRFHRKTRLLSNA